MFFFSEERNPDLMRRGNRFTTDKAYIQRVESISSKFEYIAGDKEESFVYLRCKDCGFVFKYSKVGLKPSHRSKIICNECKAILDAKRKREHEEKIRITKQIIENRRQQKIKAYEEACKHTCLRCGREFTGKPNLKYCSKECARRQSYSNKEHNRRIRINKNIHDVISLPMLVKRDKGKCWLCGKKIDYSDHTVREDGVFITGKNYPSIDHVIALANGGTHTWNNVRLAHTQCNSTKGYSKFRPMESGQMKLYC